MNNSTLKTARPLLVPNKTKVVVTGGAGFIGSHIVDELVAKNYDVHVIDNLFSGNIGHVNRESTFHNVDIRNRDEIEKIIRGSKYVFHYAAISSENYCRNNFKDSRSVNINGWKNILDICKSLCVEKVIFESTNEVCGTYQGRYLNEEVEGSPVTAHGFQKYLAELETMTTDRLGLQVFNLRYFKVYGKRQRIGHVFTSFLPELIEKKFNGCPVLFNSGEHERDFVHVNDVVALNLSIIEKPIREGVINIGSGSGISPRRLTELLDIGHQCVFEKKEVAASRIACTRNLQEKIGWTPQIQFEKGLQELLV